MLEYPPTTGKSKMKNDKEGKATVKKKDRSNLLSDDLMKNVKTIMIRTRAHGTAMTYCNIYRKLRGEVEQFDIFNRK